MLVCWDLYVYRLFCLFVTCKCITKGVFTYILNGARFWYRFSFGWWFVVLGMVYAQRGSLGSLSSWVGLGGFLVLLVYGSLVFEF